MAFSGKRYIKRQSNPTNFRIVKEKLKMCVSSFILPSALNNLISTPEDKQQSHYTVNVEIAGSAPVGSASNKNSNPVMNSGHKSHKSPPEATGRRRRGDRTVPKSDGSHDPWNSCYRQF